MSALLEVIKNVYKRDFIRDLWIDVLKGKV